MLQLPLCSHWLSQAPSQAPGLVLPLLSSRPGCIGRWWRREFEGRASGVKAVGVNPGTLGSSGIVIRYLSRFSLKISTEHFVIFLKNGGRQLNSWGPCTWNVCSLRAFADALAPVLMFGTLHFLPCLLSSDFVLWMAQFGAVLTSWNCSDLFSGEGRSCLFRPSSLVFPGI